MQDVIGIMKITRKKEITSRRGILCTGGMGRPLKDISKMVENNEEAEGR